MVQPSSHAIDWRLMLVRPLSLGRRSVVRRIVLFGVCEQAAKAIDEAALTLLSVSDVLRCGCCVEWMRNIIVSCSSRFAFNQSLSSDSDAKSSSSLPLCDC